MQFDELHRAHTYPGLTSLGCGLGTLMFGCFGLGGRYLSRQGHSPFAFAEYTTLDIMLAVFGGLVTAASLVYLVPLWRHRRWLTRNSPRPSWRRPKDPGTN